MTELIKIIFEYFGTKTGVLGEVRQYEGLWMILLILCGIAFCFYGLKSYHIVFSLVTFMTVTLIICKLMGNIANWGEIVTAFSIIGFLMAFMAYGWTYVGACIMTGLIAGMTAVMFGADFMPAVIVGLLSLAVAYFFPLPAVIVSTVWFGSVILNESGVVSWLGSTASLILLCICGLMVQVLLGRKIEGFERKWPGFVTKLIEKRKRGKECA